MLWSCTQVTNRGISLLFGMTKEFFHALNCSLFFSAVKSLGKCVSSSATIFWEKSFCSGTSTDLFCRYLLSKYLATSVSITMALTFLRTSTAATFTLKVTGWERCFIFVIWQPYQTTGHSFCNPTSWLQCYLSVFHWRTIYEKSHMPEFLVKFGKINRVFKTKSCHCQYHWLLWSTFLVTNSTQSTVPFKKVLLTLSCCISSWQITYTLTLTCFSLYCNGRDSQVNSIFILLL